MEKQAAILSFSARPRKLAIPGKRHIEAEKS
jgi:hypothetical protein